MKDYIVAVKIDGCDLKVQMIRVVKGGWKNALSICLLEFGRGIPATILNKTISDMMEPLPDDLSAARNIAIQEGWEFNLKEVTIPE